jgi:hypothetical protein
MNKYGQSKRDFKPWFVRSWQRTNRTYIGNLRDVNIAYKTEDEARAAYDAPFAPGETEKVLFHYPSIDAPYEQVARRSKAAASKGAACAQPGA